MRHRPVHRGHGALLGGRGLGVTGGVCGVRPKHLHGAGQEVAWGRAGVSPESRCPRVPFWLQVLYTGIVIYAPALILNQGALRAHAAESRVLDDEGWQGPCV